MNTQPTTQSVSQPTRTVDQSNILTRAMVLVVVFVALTGILFFGMQEDEALESNLQRLLYPMGMSLVLSGLAVVWLWMQTRDKERDLPIRPSRNAWLYPVTVAASALFLCFALRSTGDMSLVYSIGVALILGAVGMVCVWAKTAQSDRRNPLNPRKRLWVYPVVAGVLALLCMALGYLYLGVWPIGDRSVMTVDMHHQYGPLLAQLRDMMINGGDGLYSFNVGLGTSFLPLFGYYLASPFNLILALFPEHLLTEGILVITLLKNALSAAFFAACVQYIYKKRNPVIPAVAIMYSLMMYMLAYSWNIMWLDVVMVLPLVVMLFERMMRTGKMLGYIFMLAYALFANYYIAFMMCVFLVLYFAVWALRQKRTGHDIGVGFGRFALGSALGGGLVMFLLVPVYVGLQQTSAAGGELPEMAANFPMFDLLGQHLFRTVPTIRSGNLPNLYCGLLPVLLAPLFATNKGIALRRRVCYLGMLAVLGFSCVINQFDLVWHGLHAPNDLPYRFTFLYCFVLLLIGYETLMHLKDITLKQIGSTLAVLLVYLLAIERFGNDKYTFDNIYISLMLLAVYGVVIGLVAAKKWTLRPAYMFLTLIVTAELLLNTGSTMRQLHANEYFTAHDDYVDNETTESLRYAVAETEKIADKAYPNGFYRMEFLPRRTTVDPALYDYRGMTVFASSNPYNTVKFMGRMGYAINGVNSYLYNSFVAPSDSLLGLNYVILENKITNHDQLELVATTQTGSTRRYIYKNKYALPLGYMVNHSVRQWLPIDYDPITSQNTLFSSLTGNRRKMYTLHDVKVAESSMDVADVQESSVNGKDTSFSLSGQDMTAYFTVDIPQKAQTFIYVDCRAASKLSAATITSEGTQDYWSITTHEPFIIDAGKLNENDQVEITVEADNSCIGNIYVATLNEDVFEETMSQLSAEGLQISSFSDRRIEGKVTALEDGVMMTSITYDKGWTVLVDGKEVTPLSTKMVEAADTGTVGMAEALLCFEVPEGTHTITLTFFPEGLKVGLLLSGMSLVGLILLLVWQRLSKKQKKQEKAAVAAMTAELGEFPAELSTDELDAAWLFEGAPQEFQRSEDE